LKDLQRRDGCRVERAATADIAAPRDDEGQDDRGDELFSHSSPSSGASIDPMQAPG
jgi:hypothetical protein